jgi:hypothetical protein
MEYKSKNDMGDPLRYGHCSMIVWCSARRIIINLFGTSLV